MVSSLLIPKIRQELAQVVDVKLDVELSQSKDHRC